MTEEFDIYCSQTEHYLKVYSKGNFFIRKIFYPNPGNSGRRAFQRSGLYVNSGSRAAETSVE